MDTNTGLMVLAGALVLVTAYYAWTVRRMAAAVEDMVAATKEMVETASRTQTLSLAPQVECRTVNVPNPEPESSGEAAGKMISETTITNVGAHRVRLSRVRLETDSGGEQVRRFVTHWLEPGGAKSSRSRSARRAGRRSSSTWKTWRARVTWWFRSRE